MTDHIEDGGPAFPQKEPLTTDWQGMPLRDYMAIHSVQPGCGEISSMAGLTYVSGIVWKDENTRIGTFDNWFCSLPLTERLDLYARVKYAMADAMLKARKS